ncbi:MAG: hypothetical protein A2268_03130 [Candidatus Raymondbacteria bacterium RifOxyA12_full_50_37]|uniref:Uncharacterized protein n=1 Tax=Candidatus Raymondbacteria bacterium RIFOXYD12_FULL_49_13 TaxID=1817890 RepID=A0A1F7F832_UNCRA|nr:MAG: hypothetical protein A2268_03130 [Candidatus Raymondbacteria bacterium RifOxyA12_full_50_37]OGJ86733.1 MAG: hypothetical protein A2248_09860 [Candidatus Raymondbacteria bacterium RIFOXYA2_FULL_49_16]OGJ97795.1 MAG: hypothetical protein A2487_11220 [Candidatus Raymondbacteria bacterium RifOxyC12_full_50_8]OGK01539.1 MAG: hypothetical protein A2350_06395 [Candidatus Raymondbacteria bacterium RifOxyB12_full_50_8]OGK02825.1 MAG: hypothetical protein A2519_06570 [Candidatus Raymondbacteria b
MTLKGHVDNGVIILDEPVNLPNGTRVTIQSKVGKVKDPSGIAGSWVDDRSAEEIIKDIYGSRRSKR